MIHRKKMVVSVVGGITGGIKSGYIVHKKVF